MCTLKTTSRRGKVGLTEGCGWRWISHVVCTSSHGLTHPIGRTSEEPIRCQWSSGSSGVSKVDCCITLHVMYSICACRRIDIEFIIINLEGKILSHRTESFRVWCYLIIKHVSKQREGCTVCTRRVGCYVDCGDDHSTLVVTACTHDNVLAVCTCSQQTLEVSTIFHVSITDTRNVLRAHGVRVENCSCNGSIALEALEGCGRDIIHNWMEWVSDVKIGVENLRTWCVSTLNIHAERQASIQSNIQSVDLATLWTKMRLYRTTSGHERLECLSVCSRTKLLVVTSTTTLNILCGDLFLPWQENLVVVRHPSSVKIGRPIVD